MARSVEARQVQLRDQFGVEAQPVESSVFRSWNQRWLERFCPNVKRKTGSWIYRGYRWHAYSYEYESALRGTRAFNAYVARQATDFYLFFEFDDLMFHCTGPPSPDLRPLDDDVYVFPHDLAWTFVVTHEMSLGLGPYFAEAVV